MEHLTFSSLTPLFLVKKAALSYLTIQDLQGEKKRENN